MARTAGIFLGELTPKQRVYVRMMYRALHRPTVDRFTARMYCRGLVDGLDYADRAAADWQWRHRECGPDCCVTGDRCEDA